MLRYIIKVALYFAILLFFMAVGWLPEAAILLMLAAAAVLAAVNTLIRPLLVVVALPFNIITLGIASVFANLLCLVIASAIMGGAMTAGFWIMLLTAFVIMLADDGIRLVRQAIKRKRAAV
ncbi:MAG: phage holin family protein [Eubacteriales bacterium]|nr:phage holin family protein [Eubacteriales bacterium]